MLLRDSPLRPSRRHVVAMMAGVLVAGGGHAVAQTAYPSRPVRVLMPFPAGTSPDVIGRLWGERFTQMTGQPIVVENRPGAATIIATQAAAHATPDGYTLLWTANNTFSINPYLYNRLPYSADDFVPVSRVLDVPLVLVVSAESKIRTLDELLRTAKSKPGSLTYASIGIGTSAHLAMARLLNAADASAVHVPYKENYLPDVIAQRVDVAFEPSTTTIAQLKAGKLRALAVSSIKRVDALPDVPTVGETFAGYVADSWQGIFTPKGTPDAIVAKLADVTQQIVQSTEFRMRLLDYGLTPVGGTSSEFRRFLVEDARAWAKVVKDNNVTTE